MEVDYILHQLSNNKDYASLQLPHLQTWRPNGAEKGVSVKQPDRDKWFSISLTHLKFKAPNEDLKIKGLLEEQAFKSTLNTIQKHIRALANPDIEEHSKRFFKTGPGDYAEGNLSLGVRVPVIRTIAKTFATTPLPIVFKLLESKFHEERLLVLIMMVNRCKKRTCEEHKLIYDHYLSHNPVGE